MAKKTKTEGGTTNPANGGEWTHGYIGGEIPDAPGRGFGDVGDWDGDECPIEYCDDHYGLPIMGDKSKSDHFLKQRYLRDGHNTMDMGTGNPQDSLMDQLAGRLKPGQKPIAPAGSPMFPSKPPRGGY